MPMIALLLSSTGDNATQWLVYGAAALALAYIVLRPMMRKKRDPLDVAPTFSPSRQRHVEREMNNLLVELSAMARQITAQLDTRAKKLELLIDEADQRIAQLKSLQGERAPRSAPAAKPVFREVPPADMAPAPSPEGESRYGDIYGLADQGQTPQEIAQRLNRPRGEVELILALRR